jgi:SAM-dependent methyltransferase
MMDELIQYSFDSYSNYTQANFDPDFATISDTEKDLIAGDEEFFIDAKCFVCDKDQSLLVDYQSAPEAREGVVRRPNWRERLVCPDCHLNNRMRAAVHLLEVNSNLDANAEIYIGEQLTYLYLLLKQRYPRLVGSEYLGEEFNSGDVNEKNVRHEDMTDLSFSNDSCDAIMHFDVLEHIPDFKGALVEALRCLRPGGHLFFSAPFRVNEPNTLVRAELADGIVRHIEEPEYHGDPVNPSEGILCFYHFGWELLDEMKRIGFYEPKVHLYWSKDFGYLGGYQVFISGSKPSI